MSVEAITVSCDESGNDGENLLTGRSPVFAHASVALTAVEAGELMEEVKRRTGSQRAELKSKTILQPGHRDTARWLLQHPLLEDRASIHLTHKRYFIVSKFFDATVEEVMAEANYDMYADGSALCAANILHFLAPPAFEERWEGLLLALQTLLRCTTAADASVALTSVEAAFARVLAVEHPLNEFVRLLHAGVPHLQKLSSLQRGEGIEFRLRTLDPLISAVGATVMFWASHAGRPVEMVHDVASELTTERIKSLAEHLAAPELVTTLGTGRGVELSRITLADSSSNAGVQVADLLAGLGRVVAEDLLAGKENAFLSDVEPFFSPLSVWPNRNLMKPQEARAVAAAAWGLVSDESSGAERSA